MKKVAIVYWSGTGNTEAMAGAVQEGVQAQGAECGFFSGEELGSFLPSQWDSIAFGCPSMGSEELEETVFEPMFAACESALSGKEIGLFGSYGWGDGEWMRNWEERCQKDGARLVTSGILCCGAPEEETLEECRALGKALAK